MSIKNTFSEKWNSLCGKPSVRIIVKNGKLKVIQGKVKSSVLRELEELFLKHDCPNAWLHYYSPHRARSFEFSKSIPTQLHQRIRNLWNF